MKKTILTIALALMLGLGAKAQNNEMFDWNNYWDNPAESSYDMSDLGMFDWADFTDLFDQATQIDVVDNWVTDFRLFDFSEIGNRDVFDLALPDHGQNTDFDAPLGSGLVMLLGMGGAYLVAKRRKE